MDITEILGAPSSLTPFKPPAGGTSSDGFRLGGRVQLPKRQEAGACLEQIRRSVGVVPRILLTGPEPDGQPRRGSALDAGEDGAVVGHLQERARRGMAGELGIAHLVGVIAQCAGHAIHADEEIRVAEPWGVQQCCLEDHFGACAKGLDRLDGALANRGSGLIHGPVDLNDVAAEVPQAPEHGLLVHVAASRGGGVEGVSIFPIRLKLDGSRAHLLEVVAQICFCRGPSIKGGAMVAPEPSEEVACRVPGSFIGCDHASPSSARPFTSIFPFHEVRSESFHYRA